MPSGWSFEILAGLGVVEREEEIKAAAGVQPGQD